MKFWVRDQPGVKPVGCLMGTGERRFLLSSSHLPTLVPSLTLSAVIVDLPVGPTSGDFPGFQLARIFPGRQYPMELLWLSGPGFPGPFCCCPLWFTRPFQHGFDLRHLAYAYGVSRVKHSPRNIQLFFRAFQYICYFSLPFFELIRV